MGAANLASRAVPVSQIDDARAICDHMLRQTPEMLVKGLKTSIQEDKTRRFIFVSSSLPVRLHTGAVGGGAARDNHTNKSL